MFRNRGASTKPNWWVTYAKIDLDANRALKLCSTIRGTSSTKEVCIIIGEGISQNVLLALHASFDYVVGVKDEKVEGEMYELPMDVKLSLLAWKVCLCQKAVLLRPDSPMLSNCDKLFEVEGDICSVPTTQLKSDPSNQFGTSMLVFKPSRTTFCEIMAHVKEGWNGNDAPVTLHRILKSYFGSRWTQLTNEYGIISHFGEGDIDLGETTLGISSCIEKKDKNTNVSQGIGNAGVLNHSEPIAIVGLSCRIPDTNTEDEFWDLFF